MRSSATGESMSAEKIDDPRRALRHALARYDSLPLGVRAFVHLRHWLTPLARILSAVPPGERLLDVGCGHGLFSHALALSGAGCHVLGIDPSAPKIAIARESARGLDAPRFVESRVEDVAERGFDTITVLDVLYLLPPPQKLALLRACRERIAPTGTLLVKTNDTRPRWKYAVTRAQERLMTTAGLTLGQGTLHFLGREANAALIREAGFAVEARELRTPLPYPAVLFVARPR